MDHALGAGAEGVLEELPSRHSASAPSRPNGIYVIRFRNLQGEPQHRDFIRGYGFQGGCSPQFHFDADGYGASYKRAVREGVYGIRLTGFCESLPRSDNYVEIDRDLNDAWGSRSCASI